MPRPDGGSEEEKLMRRDLTVAEARALLGAADLRGRRRWAGISAATMAEAFGVDVETVWSWERHEAFPRGWMLLGYARVVAGLGRHAEIPGGEEGARDAA